MLKRKYLVFLLTLVFLTLMLGISTTTQAAYTLVWSDEFDGSSVNSSNWTFETGGGGWGNNELQYYTNGANASVSGGILTITAKKENMGGYAYTSTRIKTAGKREFKYGKIEARLSVPMGKGLWPAFWMLGSNIGSVGWPACGETDIMEHINTETKVYGTIHWDNNGYASYGGNTTVSTPSSYHVYTIEWTSAYIKWFVDGVQYHEANILNGINGTNEFHNPFFIILNLAVGGNWPGSPDGSTVFPAYYRIDYVRVYQEGGSGSTPSPTASPTATATPSSNPNLALGRPVTVSSYGSAGYEGSKAVDGNTGTRWGSQYSDPQWIYVDLGSSRNISKVVLNWEGAYASSYKVQTSNDATNWTDKYSTTTGNGGIDTITFATTSARYVRMYGTARGTVYGYSLWEFEVYQN